MNFIDTTSNTTTVWRRHSVRSLHSASSFEHYYPQALGLDPREPDPVYVTLREAARKRSDTGSLNKKKFRPRRRCYSENGLSTNNTSNKMKNQQIANGILTFWGAFIRGFGDFGIGKSFSVCVLQFDI